MRYLGNGFVVQAPLMEKYSGYLSHTYASEEEVDGGQSASRISEHCRGGLQGDLYRINVKMSGEVVQYVSWLDNKAPSRPYCASAHQSEILRER